MSPWPPERLDDRFKAIDEALKDVQYDIRVISPLAGQVGILDANLSAARVELRELRTEIKEDRAVTRREQVQLIATVIGFFAAVAGGTILAVVTGVVGG